MDRQGKKIKILAAAVILMMVGMTIISTAQQLGVMKYMPVWTGAVKVNYGSVEITNQLQPIIVGNMAYLPLRSAASLFDKNIDYNYTTKTVTISDTSSSLTTHQSQTEMSQKDAEIAKLKKRIAALESGSSGNSSADIEDLEDELNDDYDEYKSIDLKFTLSGNKSDITVKITADKDDWEDNLSKSTEKTFLQKICDAVLDEFEDADIDGTVKDGSATIVSFTADSDGDVVIESSDASEFEDSLNSDLEDGDFGKLAQIDNDDLNIELAGNETAVNFYINIDLDEYESEWDDLSKSDIEDFLEEVYNEVAADSHYKNSTIIGYFYDTNEDDTLAKCYESNGELIYVYY